MARLDTELLGLQIVALENASIVGEVDGLIVDDASLKVAGFLVDLGLFEAQVLPFAAAVSIGNDAIIVQSDQALQPITTSPVLEALANKDVGLSDAKAITRSGKTVGMIGDFFVNTENGAIEGMEFIATDQAGYAADVAILPTVGVVRLGRDIIVLADDYHLRLQRDVTSLDRLRREDTGTMTITPLGAATEPPPSERPEPSEAEAVAEAAKAIAAAETDAAAVAVDEALVAEAVAEEALAEAALANAVAEAAVAEAMAREEIAEEAVAEAIVAQVVADEAEEIVATTDAGAASEAPMPATEDAASGEAPAPNPDEDAFTSQQRHFLIGKRVLRRIETPAGEVIAEEGDLVTYEMIQAAKNNDQLLILSLNVE